VAKFFLVMLTITAISALAIFITCLLLRFASRREKREKEIKLLQQQRARTNSQSSGSTLSAMNRRSSVAAGLSAKPRKTIVMPPAVLQPIVSVKSIASSSGGCGGGAGNLQEKSSLLPQISEDGSVE
jgi:hypothetical protein